MGDCRQASLCRGGLLKTHRLPALRVVMRHNPGHGIMTELMERGPVPIDRLEIGSRRRHLHEIARRVIVGVSAADAEIRARGGNQCLGAWLNLTWWRRDNRRRTLLGQAIALVGVEDGNALEKRDGARLLASF